MPAALPRRPTAQIGASQRRALLDFRPVLRNRAALGWILIVIGVHTPKFDNEKDTGSIRKAVLRYEIAHPVVNDADHKVWNAYDVEAWPT